jgi:hypothetical protein
LSPIREILPLDFPGLALVYAGQGPCYLVGAIGEDGMRDLSDGDDAFAQGILD